MLWLHRHKWKAVAATPMEFSMKLYPPSSPLHGMPMEKPIKQHKTAVLYRCEKCWQHKTEELLSHWTLEQLRGAEPAPM
jgi:hypothetical protein